MSWKEIKFKDNAELTEKAMMIVELDIAIKDVSERNWKVHRSCSEALTWMDDDSTKVTDFYDRTMALRKWRDESVREITELHINRKKMDAAEAALIPAQKRWDNAMKINSFICRYDRDCPLMPEYYEAVREYEAITRSIGALNGAAIRKAKEYIDEINGIFREKDKNIKEDRDHHNLDEKDLVKSFMKINDGDYHVAKDELVKLIKFVKEDNTGAWRKIDPAAEAAKIQFVIPADVQALIDKWNPVVEKKEEGN